MRPDGPSFSAVLDYLGVGDGSEKGLDDPDIVTLGTKCVLNKGAKTADFVTVEGQAGVALPADCNLDEDHVSPTVTNAETCHDPRTDAGGRIRDGSQNGLGNVCGQEGHPSYAVLLVHSRTGPKVLSWTCRAPTRF